MSDVSFEGADAERTIVHRRDGWRGFGRRRRGGRFRNRRLGSDLRSTSSRNVADGTKNRFPVTARLKSSSRS